CCGPPWRGMRPHESCQFLAVRIKPGDQSCREHRRCRSLRTCLGVRKSHVARRAWGSCSPLGSSVKARRPSCLPSRCCGGEAVGSRRPTVDRNASCPDRNVSNFRSPRPREDLRLLVRVVARWLLEPQLSWCLPLSQIGAELHVSLARN